MVDFFINLHSNISEKFDFLKKIKWYSFVRLIIKLSANICIPVYYKISNLFFKYHLKTNSTINSKLIVSLTTFPARIDRIWIVVESIMRQSIRPEKILLFLSNEQFKNDLSDLPRNLKSMQKRGLEIVICTDDFKSHKKYYYAFKKFPTYNIITIDDDFIYPSWLISDLIKLNNKYPDFICCNRALKIIVNERDLLPYKKWPLIINDKVNSSNLFFTSGGGTLFPPNSFNKEIFNKSIFMKYCKNADDVWLNFMARYNCTKIIKTDSKYKELPIMNFNDIKLSTTNLHENLNDKQLNSLRKYYRNKENRDPFKSLIN